MKNKKPIYLTFVFCLLWIVGAQAQIGKIHNIGGANTFISKLKGSKPLSGKEKPVMNLTIANGSSLAGRHNVTQKEGSETVVIGSLENAPNSTFTFFYSDSTVRGELLHLEKKLAFEYYTEKGNVMVKEVDIHKVMCIDYPSVPKQKAVAIGQSINQALPPAGDPVYNLQSNPGAGAVVLLDFDGEIVSGTSWYGGNTINALPNDFNATDINSIWEMVSEDYRPFGVNITTNLAVYNNAAIYKKIKVIITPTNFYDPDNAGGVAHLNSFSENNYHNKPCWVFFTSTYGGVKCAAEAASHEVGHTLGLHHDGYNLAGYQCPPGKFTEGQYYCGQGSWAPIMGVSYYRDVTQFSKGEYPYASNTEDDVSIITRSNGSGGYVNGFTFRADEDGNTYASGRNLTVDAQGNVAESSNYGILSTGGDIDIFRFNVSLGSACTLKVAPFKNSPDLNMKVWLYTSNGVEVTEARVLGPGPIGSPTIIADVDPGSYYLLIDGWGDANPNVDGYTDYGSMGSYFISGTITKICSPVVNKPVIAGNDYLCNTSPNQPYNMPIGSTRGATYTWSTSTGLGTFPSGNTGKAIILDPSNTSTGGYLYVTANNGCGLTNTGSLVINIASGSPPSPVTPTGPAVVCNAGANTNYYANAPGPYKQVWSLTPFTEGIIQNPYGSIAIDWDPAISGTASLKVQMMNGCATSAWSAPLAITINPCRLGSAGTTEGLSAELYPNPSSKEASLIINTLGNGFAKVEVTDMKGVLVYLNSETISGEVLTFGSEFAAGMYIVKISSGEQMKVLKFVKN
jgi:hypothetical protein